MTKRASGAFARKASDYYPTPPEAVHPLIPHLVRAGVKTFAEPCYGDGSLARHLDELGDLACIVDGDLVHGSDARDWVREDYGDVDAVITNPPWTPDIMAEIMWLQSRFVPAWFLIYSDWLFTRQSTPLMNDRCTDIVPIGRLKWIPGSKSTGFDNCCWVRMTDLKYETPVTFWPMTK